MKNKTLNEKLFFSLTRDFLDLYLPQQVGRSCHTIKAYRDALTIFRRYLYEQCELSIKKFKFSDCTRECVLDFLIYLESNGCKASTCNQRLTAIKAYIWFASDIDISVQPIALYLSRIPPRRKTNTVKEVMSEEAITSLLSQPSNTKIGLRDRTIMILLYDSAIRLNELLELRLGSLNLQSSSPYIRVLGKNNKERIVPVTYKTIQHLQNYLLIYHQDDRERSSYLFYTTIKGKTGKMSSSNVERLIKKYACMAKKTCSKIPDKVYPHMFRRTRATNLYQNGVELELISRILGHSSMETTKIYASPSLEMLRKAMDAVEEPNAQETPLWSNKEDEIARLCGLR